MDVGIVGLLVVAAVVAGAVFFARPKPTLPLDELLARLSQITGNPKLTAIQKRHEAELAYRAYQDRVVSVIGAIEDVFPNGSVVMRTSARDLPAIGVELSRVSAEQLRAMTKGKAITLRARLPGWKDFSEIADLPVGFRDAKVFFSGRWHAVKATYRVRPESSGGLKYIST